MKTPALFALAALALAAAFPAAPAVAATSYPNVADVSTETAQQRVMHLSAVIAAPRATLWRGLTDVDELRRWNTPVAWIDLRPGGVLEASYDPKGKAGDPQNIKQEILAVDPGRTFVFRNIQAPEGLPGRERFGRIVTTVSFEDAGPGTTRVTLWQVGYGGGPEDKTLWDFFRAGNAYVLAAMDHQYGKGPKPGMPDGH